MKFCSKKAVLLTMLLGTVEAGSLHAETEYEAWLSYLPLSAVAAARFESLPACVVLLDDSNEIQAAQHELIRGVRGMLGRTLPYANPCRPNQPLF